MRGCAPREHLDARAKEMARLPALAEITIEARILRPANCEGHAGYSDATMTSRSNGRQLCRGRQASITTNTIVKKAALE